MNSQPIKELFKKYRITGELLALFLEVSLSSGQRYIKDPSTIPLNKIEKVCQLLEIQVSEVLTSEKTFKFVKK